MKQREKTLPQQGHVRLPASLDRLTDLDTATDTRRLERSGEQARYEEVAPPPPKTTWARC